MVSSHLLLCALVRLRLTLIIVAQQYIASLEDIIASKKAVGRPKDLAVIEELELTLDEQKKIRKTSLWRMCMKLHYGQEFVPCSVCR